MVRASEVVPLAAEFVALTVALAVAYAVGAHVMTVLRLQLGARPAQGGEAAARTPQTGTPNRRPMAMGEPVPGLEARIGRSRSASLGRADAHSLGRAVVHFGHQLQELRLLDLGLAVDGQRHEGRFTA